MLKKSNNIQNFAGIIIVFMTIKVILMLLLVDEYNIWMFFSVQTDLIFIVIIFVYSLCKIKQISNTFHIKINKCYMLLHFISVILLIMTWSTDFAFYMFQQKIYGGKDWDDLSDC